MTKGEAIERIGRMQQIADLFGQEPEFQIEFRARCNELGRAIAAESGQCLVRTGRDLPPETVLGERAMSILRALEQWFAVQAKINEAQDVRQTPATN